MSVIRSQVLTALATAIQAEVTTWLGMHTVVVGLPDWDDPSCFPSVSVAAAGAFEFHPFEVDELEDATDSTAVVTVGDFTGKVVVTTGSRSQPEREAIQDAVLDLFLRDPLRRGVLMVDVGTFLVAGVTFTGPIRVGFTLDGDGWQDEMVMDRKRFGTLDLQVDIPALTVLRDVYTIDHLVLAVTQDLTTVDPVYDQVQVGATGLLEEYP